MDINAYLTAHDGKPAPYGDECIRLARAAGCSPVTLYMIALGHRRASPDMAVRLAEASIGAALTPGDVLPALEWMRAEDGRWFHRARVA